MQEKLLKELKKKYPGKKFEFAFVLVEEQKTIQSLLVDGKMIKFSWSPPVAEISCKYKYKALLKWCDNGVRDLMWKKEIEGKTAK